MAEVSASAMAVEQLAREGRLNIQPARTEAVEEWSDEDVDEGDEVPEEGEGSDTLSEPLENVGTHDHHGVKSDECGQSSQNQDAPVETDKAISVNECTSVLEPEPSISLTHEVEDNVEDSILDSSTAGLSSADIQNVRENLVSASEEAQQLLRDLNDMNNSG